MTNTARVVVHPNSRRAYAAERLRKAAEIEDIAQRQEFLETAVAKYGAWAAGLGVLPHRISADLAILRCQLLPPRQRLQA
jgi:hypothetical protein